MDWRNRIRHYANYINDAARKLFSRPYRIIQRPTAVSQDELEQVFYRINEIIVERARAEQKFDTIPEMVEMIELYSPPWVISILKNNINIILLAITAFTIACVGSFVATKTEPNTALLPTDIHPLFDPSDLALYENLDLQIYDRLPGSTSAKGRSRGHRYFSLLIVIVALIITNISLFLLTVYAHNPIHYTLESYSQIFVIFELVFHVYVGNKVFSFLLTAIRRNLSHLLTGFARRKAQKLALQGTQDGSIASRVRLVSKDSLSPTQKFTSPSPLSFTNIASALLSILVASAYFQHPKCPIIKLITKVNILIYSIQFFDLGNTRTSILLLFIFCQTILTVSKGIADYWPKSTIPYLVFNFGSEETTIKLRVYNILIPCTMVLMSYKLDIWKWHLDHPETEFHFLRWQYVNMYFVNSVISFLSGLLFLVTYGEDLQINEELYFVFILGYMLLTTLVLATLNHDLKNLWNYDYSYIGLPDEISEERHEDGYDLAEELTYVSELARNEVEEGSKSFGVDGASEDDSDTEFIHQTTIQSTFTLDDVTELN